MEFHGSDAAFEGTLMLGPAESTPTINPNIYGHFAEHLGRCIYEGFWVGEDSPIAHLRGIRRDVVAALRHLEVPVLRWPGGCFADEYHWKDGIGPRDQRPTMINTHWGRVVENNHFGTHEFMDLCEQIGAEPYVCGNVGSGSVREMMEWVEYMTGGSDSPMASLRRANGRDDPWSLRFFGVGNESWGCGGNMRPEYYADNFLRYQTFVKNYGAQRIQRFACGANGADFEWTRLLMDRAGKFMDGLSLHWYSVPTGDWQHKGSATDFDEAHWHATLRRTLRMDELVHRHSAIMDEFDPEKRVGLIVDEWGTWYDVEPGTNPSFLYQQNTLRDALVAAINLNIFNQNADRVTMANIAQTVNVLQALILTDGEQMLVTPTYHVFEMYKAHQGAQVVPVDVSAPPYEHDGYELPSLHVSASRRADRVLISIANLNPQRGAKLNLRGLRKLVGGRVLSAQAMNAHNSFSLPEAVRPVPLEVANTNGGALVLPPMSVTTISGIA